MRVASLKMERPRDAVIHWPFFFAEVLPGASVSSLHITPVRANSCASAPVVLNVFVGVLC